MSAVPIAPALELAGRGRPWKTRLVEFALVGGLTPLLFPLSWLLQKKLGLDAAELAVGFTFFYAAHLINDPHFSITYVLFYEDTRGRAVGTSFDRSLRIRWLFAGVVAPVMLAAWTITGLVGKSAFTIGILVQLMYLLVGWHYVKQGFGVMTVLAARRGVRFLPRERLAILAHCYAGWAYAWASPYDPGRVLEEKGVIYTSFAHPWRGLERLTLIVLLATIVPMVVLLVQKWRREGRLPIATPLLALLSSIWAWSIYSSIDPLVRYMIPALHSVQYLYIVWLLKKNEAVEREGPPYFEKSARVRLGLLAVTALGLGWVLFHGAPTMLDDILVNPRTARFTDLGITPWFAGLYACVNIHHYLMDNVIWRRDNPRTRYLRG